MSSASVSKPLPPATKRKEASALFDWDAEEAKELAADPDADMDPTGLEDMENDDWILDDLGGGMNDDDEKVKELKSGGGGIREMGERDYMVFAYDLREFSDIRNP